MTPDREAAPDRLLEAKARSERRLLRGVQDALATGDVDAACAAIERDFERRSYPLRANRWRRAWVAVAVELSRHDNTRRTLEILLTNLWEPDRRPYLLWPHDLTERQAASVAELWAEIAPEVGGALRELTRRPAALCEGCGTPTHGTIETQWYPPPGGHPPAIAQVSACFGCARGVYDWRRPPDPLRPLSVFSLRMRARVEAAEAARRAGFSALLFVINPESTADQLFAAAETLIEGNDIASAHRALQRLRDDFELDSQRSERLRGLARAALERFEGARPQAPPVPARRGGAVLPFRVPEVL